jgi:hypothetical protein
MQLSAEVEHIIAKIPITGLQNIIERRKRLHMPTRALRRVLVLWVTQELRR